MQIALSRTAMFTMNRKNGAAISFVPVLQKMIRDTPAIDGGAEAQLLMRAANSHSLGESNHSARAAQAS